MKTERIINFIISIVLIAIIVFSIASSISKFDLKEDYIEYECDVKNFKLSTTIEINKDGEQIAEVKGNVWHPITDPLTMYDMNDSKVAYAGDAYHFVAQDSHTIYVEGQDFVEMVGLVKFFGNSYEIYDKDQNLIATADFNQLNTGGKIYDTSNNLIAEYSSNFFFNDFDVRISKDCTIDNNIILMIMCSYYSDQHADNS